MPACCHFAEKLKNVKKCVSRETKTAPIRSNIVRMGHKIEGKKFRPICGQISKKSSLLCTQSKIEAKRPKQRFLAGRAVGCDFPNFWDFTKKFRLREIFWHTFDKFWSFGCRAASKRKKKHYLTLRGSQEPTVDFHITKLVPKNFFVRKLQNITRTAM